MILILSIQCFCCFHFLCFCVLGPCLAMLFLVPFQGLLSFVWGIDRCLLYVNCVFAVTWLLVYYVSSLQYSVLVGVKSQILHENAYILPCIRAVIIDVNT